MSLLCMCHRVHLCARSMCLYGSPLCVMSVSACECVRFYVFLCAFCAFCAFCVSVCFCVCGGFCACLNVHVCMSGVVICELTHVPLPLCLSVCVFVWLRMVVWSVCCQLLVLHVYVVAHYPWLLTDPWEFSTTTTTSSPHCPPPLRQSLSLAHRCVHDQTRHV